MILKRLVLFLFVSLQLFADPITIYTLPKSGTHLLKKIFELLEMDPLIDHVVSPEGVLNRKEGRCVVTMRDPRDYFVSLCNYIDTIGELPSEVQRTRPAFKDPEVIRAWMDLTEDEKLERLLLMDASIPIKNEMTFKAFDAVSKAKQSSDVLIVRFEEIIGSRGGGDDLLQKEVMLNIFSWFNCFIDDILLENKLKRSWGGTFTFNKGTIGQWKEAFSEKHIALFKEHWNQYLIDWGYETDWHWDE